MLCPRACLFCVQLSAVRASLTVGGRGGCFFLMAFHLTFFPVDSFFFSLFFCNAVFPRGFFAQPRARMRQEHQHVDLGGWVTYTYCSAALLLYYYSWGGGLVWVDGTYGETRNTKLSSRPASLCHPSESATLADESKLKRCYLYSPRRTTEKTKKSR